jgi:hypothetical protein
MLHGSTFELPAFAVAAAVGRPPTGVPHRWQNFAPGESGALQAAHDDAVTGAPHSVQKRPLTAAPHLAHVGAAEDWGMVTE